MKASTPAMIVRKFVSTCALAGLVVASTGTGAQAGKPSPSVSFSVCKVANSDGLVTELRATVTWSGARASGGSDAVETHAPGSGSSNYNLINSWSLPQALRSGSHTSVFQMYDPTANGGSGGYHTPNNVNSSLASGSKGLAGAVTWYWDWTFCTA